jgi:pyruvate/2-oxoglutarate/acetoin dehydrogenase E1 component
MTQAIVREETAQQSGRELSFGQALNEALREELMRDPAVVLLGEDIGVHGGAQGVTRGLFKEFGPGRVRNTPLAEASIAGAAVGAALTGMRPVAEIMYSDFMTIAMDQVVNQAAKYHFMTAGRAKVPMVIRTPVGAGRGNAAQHSQSVEAWFVHVPGLYVVMPSTPYDAKGLLKTAIRDDNPVIFFENRLLYSTKGYVPEGEYTIPLGVADVKRPGTDVTIVAYSRMLLMAMEAAGKLANDGISCEVIDPRTLVPLDADTICRSVRRTGKLVIVHEAVKRGGFGAEISAIVMEEAFDYLDAPIKRVAGLDTPVPYNKELEAQWLPKVTDIIKAVHEVMA